MILDGSKLSIFGDWGYPDEKYWVVPAFGEMGIRVDPDPASPDIEEVINRDIQSGNADRIASIQLTPRTAIRLYLEGKITREKIEKATTNSESITFQDIKFATEKGEVILPVVVKADPGYSVATLDKDGNII
jgi:hypothetical protein